MSSTAQIAANQANSQLSTRNAMKFGLTSSQIILPGENEADFEALHAALAAQLQPATDLESMLLDDIAAAEWRLRRIETVQNGWLTDRLNGTRPEHRLAKAALLMMSDEIRRFQKYAASYRRERESAWRKLAAMQKERKAEEKAKSEKLQNEPNPTLPLIVRRRSTAFSSLETPAQPHVHTAADPPTMS